MRTYILYFFLIIATSNTLFANSDACSFCKHKVMTTQSVFETPYFAVLVDHAPIVKGHLLVIPKRHIVKAHELYREEWEELSIIIPKIVNVFLERFNTDQYIILEKNGPNAFQHVPHVHFHLLPITSQRWSQIFSILTRKQLSHENLEKEVCLFRNYFSKEY